MCIPDPEVLEVLQAVELRKAQVIANDGMRRNLIVARRDGYIGILQLQSVLRRSSDSRQ